MFIFVLVLFLVTTLITAVKLQNSASAEIGAAIETAVEEALEGGQETVKVIVRVKGDAADRHDEGRVRILNSMNSVISSLSEDEFIEKRRFTIVNGFAGEITMDGLEKLRRDPDVESVAIDKPVRIALDDTAPLINATETWSLIYGGLNGQSRDNVTGRGQTVCIIDTGIDYTLSDLGSCLGANCKVLGGYDYVNDDADPIDDNGHGTHVAGIVASEDSAYRGIAPDAKLIAIKVLGAGGSGSTSDVVSGIEWCTDNQTTFNISVISLSLGTEDIYTTYCDDSETSFRDAVDAAVAKNISVVAATGNDGSTTGIGAPACIENATSVGWSTKADAIASNSNRNNVTALMAPGSSITSLDPSTIGCLGSCTCSGGFMTCSGTSMSAPHVSGAIALLKQYRSLESNSSHTPEYLEDVLNDTGVLIDDTGESGYDFWRINILAALESLDNSTPQISFADTSLDNYSFTNVNWFFINITSNELLDNVTLDWNGTNQSMNGSLWNWYTNKTGVKGLNTYRVYANDTAGNGFGVSPTLKIMVNNSAPATPALHAPENSSYIVVNYTLLNWTCSDVDLHNITCEVYGDNTSNPAKIINSSSGIHNGTFTFNWTELNETTYYWKIACNDSYAYSSNSTIFSFTVNITSPYVTSIYPANGSASIPLNASIWINFSENVTISTINASTILLQEKDSRNYINGTLNYSITQNESFLVPYLYLDENTTYIITVTTGVKDVSGNYMRLDYVTNFTTDYKDTDSDGTPDYNDTDDDNDGINDTQDYVVGNESDVNSDMASVDIKINGSTNLSRVWNTTEKVQIINGSDVLVEFNLSFNSSNRLYINNLTINKNITNGSIMITGLSLASGVTKSVFVDNTTSSNGVCVRDMFVSSITEISTGCNQTYEYFVPCPGTFREYVCSNNGTRFRITGLNHSAVQQANDTSVPQILSKNPSGTESSSDVTLSVVTNENASCRYSTTDLNYTNMTTNLTADSAWTTHTKTLSLSNGDYVYYVRCNDSFNNVMNSSEAISFTVSTGTTASSSGGGGGGGGGSRAKPTDKVTHIYPSIPYNRHTVMRAGKQGLAMSRLAFTSRRALSSVTIIAEPVEGNSTDVPKEINNAYQYFTVETQNMASSDVEGIIIQFRVNKSWIDRKGYDKDGMKLFRYESGRWEKLSTSIVDETEANYYYNASTPGFSVFAVAAAVITQPEYDEERKTTALQILDKVRDYYERRSPYTLMQILDIIREFYGG